MKEIFLFPLAKNFQVALAWQRQLFQQQPALNSFQTLRQLGEQLGVWPQARSEASELVESKKNVGLLIEITLDEDDVMRALKLLPNMSSTSYWGQVARAAESKYPEEAVKLYQGMAEQTITLRQRKHYAHAANLLGHVRDLYERLGDSAGWTNFFGSLKNKYAHLPALQDELKKAGL